MKELVKYAIRHYSTDFNVLFLFSQMLMIIVIYSRHGRPVNQNIAGIMNSLISHA